MHKQLNCFVLDGHFGSIPCASNEIEGLLKFQIHEEDNDIDACLVSPHSFEIHLARSIYDILPDLVDI